MLLFCVCVVGGGGSAKDINCDNYVYSWNGIGSLIFPSFFSLLLRSVFRPFLLLMLLFFNFALILFIVFICIILRKLVLFCLCLLLWKCLFLLTFRLDVSGLRNTKDVQRKRQIQCFPSFHRFVNEQSFKTHLFLTWIRCFFLHWNWILG